MSARWTVPAAPVIRSASRKNAAFLALRSTRCTIAPGVSASAQASTTPGKPPPLPRSTQIFAVGARGKSCSESEIWRGAGFWGGGGGGGGGWVCPFAGGEPQGG